MIFTAQKVKRKPLTTKRVKMSSGTGGETSKRGASKAVFL